MTKMDNFINSTKINNDQIDFNLTEATLYVSSLHTKTIKFSFIYNKKETNYNSTDIIDSYNITTSRDKNQEIQSITIKFPKKETFSIKNFSCKFYF